MRNKASHLLLLALGFLATTLQTVFAQQNSSAPTHPLLIQAREQLQKTRAAIPTAYFEFIEENAGSLAQWNYKVTNHYRVYFDQTRFYCETKAPGYESYDNETAFDGKIIWRRSRHGILKTAVADALGSPNYYLLRLPYLEAAGIHGPEYPAEIAAFRALEPAALHHLDTAKLTQAESLDGKLRLAFEVRDPLASVQYQFSTNKPASAQPIRKVALVLDPARGFAMTEREEWNAIGRRTGRIVCEDWKFYEKQGIWLPGRCIASHFARPHAFVEDYSDEPIHTVTHLLTDVSFEKKDIATSFGPKEERRDIFASVDPSKSPTNSVSDPVIERIKAEVREHSQVMEIASWLTDVYGPRLTGSPNTKAAGEWAAQKLRSWGIENVRLETWGPFESRGWTSERFAFQAIAPTPFPIHAVPMPWSVSTPGRVEGPAIRFDVHSFDEMTNYSGKLKGAFLLLDPPQSAPPNFKPLARRLTDARIEELSNDPPAHNVHTDIEETRYTDRLTTDPQARAWLAKEGVAAILFTAPADLAALFLAGSGGGGAARKDTTDPLPIIKLAADSYARIARLLEKNLPVTLSLEMQNQFHDDPFIFNLIAEIPGTDPKLQNEVVMFGAHLDSWTFATGATDNAGNCAVLLESLRILKALDLKPRRTVRIGLWTGEETGALGSKAYVAKHLSPQSPEHTRFSAYFDIDSGAGKIRGIYAHLQPRSRPILQMMIAPFNQMGLKTISPWNIGGGDANSFRGAGLPTFTFMQDPLDYETRTHHSDADFYDRLIADDLQFNTAVISALAWQSAQQDELFPR